MVPAPGSSSRTLESSPATVNPLSALFCAFRHYKGPSGRHIAIVLHVGQASILLGALLLVLAYTVLKEVPSIIVQQVAGLFAAEIGVAMMLAGFVTYRGAQKCKVGGASPFWAKQVLVALYTWVGCLCGFVGMVVSVVGFNLHEDWMLAFRVAGPMSLALGILLFLGARAYPRMPCYHLHQPTSPQEDNHSCSCPQHPHHLHPHHQHLHTISSVQVRPRDASVGPVVVYSSGGVPPTPTFLPPLPAARPPEYESLPARLEQDLPPSYVFVSPMSPPPSYLEACDSPKENDGDQNAVILHAGAPPGYSPSYEACVCPGSARHSDCVVTELSGNS